MKHVLVKFDEPIVAPGGEMYFAQAVGSEAVNGMWEGSVEFSAASAPEVVDTGRETTQPNRPDVEYWAQGLSRVYLQGALARALSAAGQGRDLAQERLERRELNFGTPRNPPPWRATLNPRPVLNPFEAYAKGEAILRNELAALSRDHLDSIASAYRLNPGGRAEQSNAELVSAIVDGVKRGASRWRDSRDAGVAARNYQR